MKGNENDANLIIQFFILLRKETISIFKFYYTFFVMPTIFLDLRKSIN
jgi:hypothetical protein